MPGTGDRAWAAHAGGEGGPALEGDLPAHLIACKELMDATPGPVSWAPHQAPELSRSGRRRVSRPGLWDRREVGQGDVRQEGGNVEPGARPVRGPGGKIGPRAEIEAAKGTEEGEGLMTFPAQLGLIPRLRLTTSLTSPVSIFESVS